MHLLEFLCCLVCSQLYERRTAYFGTNIRKVSSHSFSFSCWFNYEFLSTFQYPSLAISQSITYNAISSTRLYFFYFPSVVFCSILLFDNGVDELSPPFCHCLSFFVSFCISHSSLVSSIALPFSCPLSLILHTISRSMIIAPKFVQESRKISFSLLSINCAHNSNLSPFKKFATEFKVTKKIPFSIPHLNITHFSKWLDDMHPNCGRRKD